MPPLPAAQLTNLHVCPMVTGIVPHVGGPIVGPGLPNVILGVLPVAVVGDVVTCVGPPDAIAPPGVPGVLIGNRPVARVLGQTVHGGVISGPGCVNFLVNDVPS